MSKKTKSIKEVYREAEANTGMMWDTGYASPTFRDLFPHIVSGVADFKEKHNEIPTHVRLSPMVKLSPEDVDVLHNMELNVVQHGMPFPSYIWIGGEPVLPVRLGELQTDYIPRDDVPKTEKVEEPAKSVAKEAKKESSVIKMIAPIGEKTLVIFNTGQGYLFNDIPADVVANWQAAESLGKYWNEHIKGKYEGVKTT